ncbi:MAG: hypothetical protein CMM99_00705 [Rickettsiales bacterium]|nr:hypothetical protein [Rickettsiales bacterium]
MAFSFMKLTSKWGESIAAPKKIHPELEDVKQGDQLLVVNFTPDEEFTNRVKESDNFLQQSLKDRIEELDDDDDDDEGGALVPAIR